MRELVIVFVTASSLEEAEKIARALVDSGAAACANVVPSIVSVYAWKGETIRENEALLLVKTTRALFPLVRETVERLHSYGVPEIVAVPVSEVSDGYLAYLEGILGPRA